VPPTSALIKGLAFNVKGLSSSLVALESARIIGLEGKFKVYLYIKVITR
jgi:hypothetical protein